jgi:hypothetical protein
MSKIIPPGLDINDCIDTAVSYLWKYPWLGLVPNIISGIPNPFKRFTRTRYGIKNEEQKRNYNRNSMIYYKKNKFKRYKWISNYYNYKRDYLLNVFVAENSNELNFHKIGTTYMRATNYPTLEPENDNIKIFLGMFDDWRVCGMAFEYKPYQTVKTDPNTGNNQTPNLMFAILTGLEHESFGITQATDETKTRMVDRPYTRIIAADDDLRMYRPFRINPRFNGDNNGTAWGTDSIFHNWIPTKVTNKNWLYVVGFLMGGYDSARTTKWNMGTMKITVYYKFRNSKI